jgi:hypothetical protein
VASKTHRVTGAFDARGRRDAGVRSSLLPAFFAFNDGDSSAGRLYQEAEECTGCFEFGIAAEREWVEPGSASSGLSAGWAGLELSFSRYAVEALGSPMSQDEDALDPGGAEPEADDWQAQISYLLPNKQTKIGFSYGACRFDETAFEADPRGVSRDRGAGAAEEAPYFDQQTAFTVGVSHDVRSWFKLVGEYSSPDRQRFNGQEQDSEIFAVGGFFMW